MIAKKLKQFSAVNEFIASHAEINIHFEKHEIDFVLKYKLANLQKKCGGIFWRAIASCGKWELQEKEEHRRVFWLRNRFEQTRI